MRESRLPPRGCVRCPVLRLLRVLGLGVRELLLLRILVLRLRGLRRLPLLLGARREEVQPLVRLGVLPLGVGSVRPPPRRRWMRDLDEWSSCAAGM